MTTVAGKTPSSSAMSPGRALLTIESLSVDFDSHDGSKRVVDGLDLELRQGGSLALVGESGSGKSVTAMSILDLLPRTARRTGKILFEGVDLVQASAESIRRIRGNTIAMIFQEPMTALNPVYTIGDQLEGAIRAHRSVSRQAAQTRALELLQQVNMPDPELKLRQYPHQLSGGQRQRAMIAMAISAEPKLLIADEPTTALDVTIQAEILDLLIDLQERLGMALLIITHDMGVVADIADRVIVMRDGKRVEGGRAVDVFARPEAEYTRELLSAVPRLDMLRPETEEPEPDPVARPSAVRLDDVVVEFPGEHRRKPFQAVKGVGLDVGIGEVVGLVGESGSGKSTIGRVIAGIIPVKSGTVSLVGKRLDTAGKSEEALLRRKVSMVFQDPASSLNPRSTIGRSITAPLRWAGGGGGRVALNERARELLDMVRIPPSWVDRFPYELSGGQRQRVAIARALAANPSLIIADEPTSALDVSVQATVLTLFRELHEALGFSCLFITHNLAVVQEVADRVIVLEQGRVIEEGQTDRILRSPRIEYTQVLIASAPIADPIEQRARRELRRRLLSEAELPER